MSTIGFFEHILNNAHLEFNKISASARPRYVPLKNAITEALIFIDVSISYNEISKDEGEKIKSELKTILDNLCMLPELRKKGVR